MDKRSSIKLTSVIITVCISIAVALSSCSNSAVDPNAKVQQETAGKEAVSASTTGQTTGDNTAKASPGPTLVPAGVQKNEIEWLEKAEITVPFGKYPRIVKITKGKHAGELLLTYQDNDHGGNFWSIRSKDEGITWSKPEMMLARDTKTDTQLANCNIIELQDGRLMMVHTERERLRTYAPTAGVKVRYSSDGGETWTADRSSGKNVATRETGDLILRGDGWEPRQIQVPHDKNGDGNNDIYVFWTNHFHPEYMGDKLEQNDKVGQGVAYIASYDNGKTWYNPSKERYSGGILFRSFDEQGKEEVGSGGGMPTPFVLSGNRLAFVAEAIDQNQSPWLVASDPNDWDFESFLKQPFSSIEFTGLDKNDNAYPQNRESAWLPTSAWGGAPYASVLPNGKIAISQNSNHRIRVWVADSNGKNAVEQAAPFGTVQKSFYSFIEPVNDSIVIAGAYEPDNNNKIMVRRGRIKR